jgi:hypothetical protein
MKVSGQLHAPADLLPGEEHPVPIGFVSVFERSTQRSSLVGNREFGLEFLWGKNMYFSIRSVNFMNSIICYVFTSFIISKLYL